MYVPTFGELAGDADVFFAEHFNRRPLLRRGALRADPRDLLSIDDLDAMLTSEAIRPPYFDVAKNGRQVLRSVYTEPVIVQEEHVTDRVVPEHVARLVRSGATLTWSALNHHRPNLRALARIMTTVFASRAEVVALMTPAGKRGLSPHHDPTDVFVIQVEGRKAWKVWPVPDPRPGEAGHAFDEAALGEPEIAAVLEPGDVLYMPYNCPHVAQAEDQMSLHVSVTVKARRWGDLLHSVVDRLVAGDPVFWDNPRLRDEAAAAAGLKAVAAALAEHLLRVDPERELELLVSEGLDTHGVREARYLRELSAADGVEPATELVVNEGVGIDVLERSESTVRASIGGAVYNLPAEMIGAVDALRGSGPRTPARAGDLIAGASEELSTESARTLVRVGVLRVSS